MTLPCYRSRDNGVRFVKNGHRHDCAEATWHAPLVWVDCDGCEPCHRPHCGVCGARHVDRLTCPSCVGDVREHLREIVRLDRATMPEAVVRGSATSEAAMLAGPVAEPSAWRQRRRYGYRDPVEVRTKSGGIYGDDHPLWVLGTWDLLVTEHYDHSRTARVTVPSAAAYLAANLTDLAQDEDFAFEDLAADLERCRKHLESVLHDGEQVETAAPCVTCGREVVKTESGYRCQRCNRDMSDNEYRLAVRVAYVAHADRLCASDLADRIGVPASTVRRWVNIRRIQRAGEQPEELPPLLRSCGRDSVGRRVYRVQEAEELRDRLRQESA